MKQEEFLKLRDFLKKFPTEFLDILADRFSNKYDTISVTIRMLVICVLYERNKLQMGGSVA